MFKLSLIGGTLAIILATVNPVQAQSAKSNQSLNEAYGVSPRELISMGRQGRFVEQGIPSHNNFRSGVRAGRITAEELIASAIANNRLTEEAANDQNYLKTVENHLKSGGCDS